ncbi:MAG: peptidoglycan-binding protein [Acidobacteriota bacterium]
MAVLCVLLGLSSPLFPATAQTSKAPRSSAKKVAPAPPSTAKKAAPTRKSAPGKKTARRKAKPKTPSWRTGQQVPTRERYAEIQRVLAERGYFKSAVTGVWGPESVDALKRFQRDQNLEPSGKLNSLSLIALGLGPSRDSNPPPASGLPPPASEPKPPQ